MTASELARVIAILDRVADLDPAELAVAGTLGTLRAQAFIASLPLKRLLDAAVLPDMKTEQVRCKTSQC